MLKEIIDLSIEHISELAGLTTLGCVLPGFTDRAAVAQHAESLEEHCQSIDTKGEWGTWGNRANHATLLIDKTFFLRLRNVLLFQRYLEYDRILVPWSGHIWPIAAAVQAFELSISVTRQEVAVGTVISQVSLEEPAKTKQQLVEES